MQAVHWWGLTCLILLVASDFARGLSVPFHVREPGNARESVKQTMGIVDHSDDLQQKRMWLKKGNARA